MDHKKGLTLSAFNLHTEKIFLHIREVLLFQPSILQQYHLNKLCIARCAASRVPDRSPRQVSVIGNTLCRIGAFEQGSALFVLISCMKRCNKQVVYIVYHSPYVNRHFMDMDRATTIVFWQYPFTTERYKGCGQEYNDLTEGEVMHYCSAVDKRIPNTV